MKTSQYSNYRAIILSLSYLILFLSFPSPSQSAKPKCNAQDKKVLLQIKAALNFTSWIPDIECCDWYGLECDRNTSRVISLAIFNNDISGQIPPAVGDLPYLKTLDMRKLPYLVGEIPPAISKLSQLTFLRLDWNNLSGPVPSFLSQLKNLYFLDLSFNKFSGSIPPSLSELPNLLALHLDRNKLTGNIPESFGNFAGNGKTPDLFLSHNMLTGPIPRSLGDLNFSGTIDLSRNRLEGDPSFLFGKSKTVLFVDLFWKWPRMRRSLQVNVLIRTTLFNLLLDVSKSDNIVWSASSNGLYYVKLAYEKLKPHFPKMCWATLVWFIGNIPTFDFITWLACKGKLSTRSRLKS